MGSAVSVPTAFALCLITGGIVYGFVQSHPNPPQYVSNTRTEESSGAKKGKKKKATGADKVASTSQKKDEQSATPIVVSFPPVVPGSFEGEAQAQAPTKPKSKKKKGKKAANASGGNASRTDDAQSESSATAPETGTPVPRTKRKSPPVHDADGPWTRVESRKKPAQAQQTPGGTVPATEQTPSDAGITTSVTGTSEPTEDEQELDAPPERAPENRRTLAERLLPKPRKTKVDECVASLRS